MAACEDETKAYKDARNDFNAALRDLDNDIKQQVSNGKHYWARLVDAYAEAVILALDDEFGLGAALGGFEAFLSPETNLQEQEINDLHSKIEDEKDGLVDLDDAVQAAEEDLCDCLRDDDEEVWLDPSW